MKFVRKKLEPQNLPDYYPVTTAVINVKTENTKEFTKFTKLDKFDFCCVSMNTFRKHINTIHPFINVQK